MNELREKDFVKVPPGGAFDPYQSIDDHGFSPNVQQLHPGNFRAAGEYRLRFVYSTRSDKMGEWFGDVTNAKLAHLFRQVPKVEVRSNELKVTVVEPGK